MHNVFKHDYKGRAQIEINRKTGGERERERERERDREIERMNHISQG